ncbi:hypothetical protein [Streptosporangium saharense]|uniref:Septum formation initiator n=1 Tax=Streptosporangium saharense TaxID=1706840 RepID=A0A7W7VN53_9ACTN|nr:hypothetical protein [Streptosporangium saharense]MBB4916482.1 hypothetical protein [Streptosporangium saharense]
MRRRLLLALTGWLATAAAATVAGVAVLNVLGAPLSGAAGHALTPKEVRAELAAASARPPLPSPASSPGASARTKVISTPGGSVVAACQDGLVRLRSWSPAQGYSVDDAEPGPASKATVEFESGDTELKVEVRCAPGDQPVHTVKP